MKEDWIESPLGEIFETVTGNTPPKEDIKNYGDKIPFIKPPQVHNNIITTSLEFLSSKGKEKARILPINSVLVTCIGNLGRIGINKTEIAFNQQINAIKPLEGIEPLFIFYQAQSSKFRNDLEILSTSTTVALVNKTNFNTIDFKVAPLPIQRAIVAKIEELFSSLDSGVADLKKAQAQLVIYRQAILKKAFDLKSDMYKIEDLCDEIFAGGDRPKEYFSKEKTKELTVPVIANAVGSNGLYGYTKTARVTERAITIAARGSGTGHVELRDYPFVPIVRLITIIPNLEKVILEFLMYFLKNLNIEYSGSAIPQLTIPMVKNLQIHIPSLKKQHAIVREIESRLSVCDKVEESITESLIKAEALRQSILKKAFEGKLLSEEEIAKCKAEKDYEPASVLLERIKAEKKKK